MTHAAQCYLAPSQMSLCGSFVDTLSHFIIPIPQREKQKFREVESRASLALELAVTVLACCPRFFQEAATSCLDPDLWLLRGCGICVIFRSSSDNLNIQTQDGTCFEDCENRANLSFPRQKLPTDDRLQFFTKPWVSSRRDLKNLSQSERLLTIPHSVALFPQAASLPVRI